ncbi:hypothetical protein [Mucilaginibacter agri]|uniref:Uncharacterized protein n=1 Tax=Mucilaginibacter agri TaxID=2695265 RepID=A0A965ZJC6_9SPHI|nr:hypothetical protein [Mucilaginibacter agri]NCD70787.1 hypothetical protein [Mucilaginibacter agri]
MNNQTNSNPGKKNKGLLIGLIALIVLGGVALANFTSVKLTFEYLFQFDHFSSGDNVYIKSKFFKTDSASFKLCRLIRPMTEHDVDSLNLSSSAKAELKLKLNPSLKPYLISTHDEVAVGRKQHLIGTYISHEMLELRLQDQHAVLNFYTIHPTEQALKIDSYYLKYPDLPAGYTWANNTYYIAPMFLSNSPQ